MNPGSIVNEIVLAARDLARKGLHGAPGDPLPNLMSNYACDWINANQSAFAQIVSVERIILRCKGTIARA